MALRKYAADVEIVGGRMFVADRPALDRAIKAMPDGFATLLLTMLDKRSSPANRYYWGVVLKLMVEASDDPELTKDDMHAAMCEMFLTRRVITLVGRHGEIHEQAHVDGTSQMDSFDFYLFVEKVRKWGSEFFEIEIPDPDKNYLRARSKAQQEHDRAA